MEWIIFWLIVNCVVGYLIGRQKDDMASAIALSIFLGPIGWLIAALSRGGLRKCPHCAEFVKPEAMICRYVAKTYQSSNQSRNHLNPKLARVRKSGW